MNSPEGRLECVDEVAEPLLTEAPLPGERAPMAVAGEGDAAGVRLPRPPMSTFFKSVPFCSHIAYIMHSILQM